MVLADDQCLDGLDYLSSHAILAGLTQTTCQRAQYKPQAAREPQTVAACNFPETTRLQEAHRNIYVTDTALAALARVLYTEPTLGSLCNPTMGSFVKPDPIPTYTLDSGNHTTVIFCYRDS